MLSSIRTAARVSLRRAGLHISRVNSDDVSDYIRIYGAEAVERRRFFNIGAGAFAHPAWTNFDLATAWYANDQAPFIEHDLMGNDPLPIDDGIAEIIYTSHTIEHVTDGAVERLFSEAYRALKPNGIFRVTTGPDADSDFRAMSRGDLSWFHWDDEASANFAAYGGVYTDLPNRRPIEERWLHHVASQLAPHNRAPSPVKLAAPEIRKLVAQKGFPGCLDYFTSLCTFQREFPGNHISWWNADKIIEYMKRAGFTDVYRSGYGQSAAAVLRNTYYFDNTHPQMSVYVEAVR